ncbi:hypothetical protein ACLB2K_032584 [Fragaria x ananassa]
MNEREKRKEEKEKAETTDEEVKDSYTDVEDYISTYEPLLFEEVKSLISKDKDQCNAIGEQARQQCKQDKGFHIVTVCVDMDEGMDKEERVRNNDLVLLSKPLWSKSKVPEENYAFAVVEGQTKESITLRMYLAGEVRDLNTDVIHDCPRLAKGRSLVTSDGEGDRLFDLTKGPPGTGKTQSILVLLSAILHAIPARVKARFNHWRLASPWLSGSNPRVKTMPVSADDGFFLTTEMS